MRSLNNRSFPAVSMILLLLCIGYGQAEITPRITKFSNDPDQIRVASFNIRVGKYSSGSKHWSNRREMVISLLAGERYDVIGLQEALDFQIDEIHRSLPQYEVYAIGRGRIDSTKSIPERSGFQALPGSRGRNLWAPCFPASAAGCVWRILKQPAVFTCTIFIWTIYPRNPDPKASVFWPSRSPCADTRIPLS
jgi:hypothetical protein